MNIVYCEKCGGYTPEGFAFCPSCMRESGASEADAKTVSDLLDVATIINIGDTDESRKAAIESILKIKNRLERQEHEKEKAPQTP